MKNNIEVIAVVNRVLENLDKEYYEKRAQLKKLRAALYADNEACMFCRGTGKLAETKQCRYCEGTGRNDMWRQREIEAYGR